MSESKKLSNLKAVLVRSWRERWTDTQWSIHSKRFITDVPSDCVLLADLLLSQAMVGLSGNHLILSYFKHAINTQLIPYTVAVESIVKFDDVSKVYCIKAMAEFILNMIPNIGLNGNFEDSWKLVKSSLILLRWTIVTIEKCLQKVVDDTQSVEYCTVVNKCSEVLKAFSVNDAVLALLHIAYVDELEMFNSMREAVANVQDLLQSIQSSHLINQDILQSLLFVDKIGCLPETNKPILSCHYHMLNPSINVLLHYEATLNSINGTSPVAEQLFLIEKLQGLHRSDLYCEVLRSGYMGMINSVAGNEELKWAAFVFLKIPQIVLHLTRMTSSTGSDTDVEQGLNKFMHYVPLLNLADTKCSSDCLELLVGELHKHNVINEATHERVILRRKEESCKITKPGSQPSQQASARLILRAETTVVSILRTLDARHAKNQNQEGMFGVLGHMMSGKSFELILTAATATDKLHSFATELIKFNESARACTGEGGKQAHTRSLLFDTSFLMLCHIAQTYGMNVFACLDSTTTDDSFFIQWATSSLPENGHYKSLDLLPNPDPAKVDSLMQQFKPSNELKTGLTRWNEVCMNAPFAIREILHAWEYGILTQEVVQSFVLNLKSKMCCLAVVVATYLSSYINMVEESLRTKAIIILETIMQNTPPPDIPGTTYINERSNLMQLIISKIVQNILPRSSVHRKESLYLLPATKPISEMLKETWSDVFEKGCISNHDLLKFEHLLNVGGVPWFCKSLVRESLNKERPEDLYRGVGLLYSLFSLDLTNLTLSLLHKTLPDMLTSRGLALEILSGLRGVCLARLSIMLIVLLRKMKTFKDINQCQKGKKRSRTDADLEEMGGNSVGDEFDLRPNKMRRIADSSSKTTAASFSSTDVFLNDDAEDTLGSSKEQLNKVLGNLFKLFNTIVVGENLSQKTSFVQSFVREMIKCDTYTTSYLAKFIPPNMISQLLRTMPSQFDFDVILRMCNLTNMQGRRIAAKVICQNDRLKKVLALQTLAKGTTTDVTEKTA